ncbi:hypothetical protein [Hymenobacter sp. HDW8]|uniref:hypothetical protein n=1 Tax=Hymenobacter sp. HDW8 TaxID=2714932 RepID=UPI00140DF992|nr:hypothetical protein [Hymenobacter sp. HDW8]QIL78436.1 hypothetical protein G7064_21690 [Hymenobacter sp. HDW8]
MFANGDNIVLLTLKFLLLFSMLLLQLDSLYYTPDIDVNQGARAGAAEIGYFLFWTPQIIWGLLAAWQIVVRVDRMERGETHWGSVLVPYLMIVVVLGFLAYAHGLKLGPIRPQDYNQGLHRAMFKDMMLPSLWMLPLLMLVHLLKYGQVWNDRKLPDK